MKIKFTPSFKQIARKWETMMIKKVKRAERQVQIQIPRLAKRIFVQKYIQLIEAGYSKPLTKELTYLSQGRTSQSIASTAGKLSRLSKLSPTIHRNLGSSFARTLIGARVGKISAGSEVGTWQDNRIILGSFKPLNRLLKMEKMDTIRIPHGVKIQWGDIDRITTLYGFHFQTSRGIAYTRPFNYDIIEALESGATWDVVPRADNKYKMLFPAPRYATPSMTKRTPQLRAQAIMYAQGNPQIKTEIARIMSEAMAK